MQTSAKEAAFYLPSVAYLVQRYVKFPTPQAFNRFFYKSLSLSFLTPNHRRYGTLAVPASMRLFFSTTETRRRPTDHKEVTHGKNGSAPVGAWGFRTRIARITRIFSMAQAH